MRWLRGFLETIVWRRNARGAPEGSSDIGCLGRGFYAVISSSFNSCFEFVTGSGAGPSPGDAG